MLAVKMEFNPADLKSLETKLSKNLPEETNNSLFDYAKIVSSKLKDNALTDPLRPITSDRERAAALIRAKKLSKNRSVVTMPRSLVLLDSMNAHFVSLKRGRNITRWAQKHYGTATITGKSTAIPKTLGTVSRMGGKASKGALWVTPHHFVTRTLHDERKKLPNELRKGITKAFSGRA